MSVTGRGSEMPQYHEMTEDEMVEFLAKLQKGSREIFWAGSANPYDENAHKAAVDVALVQLRELAGWGDIV